MSEAQEIEKRLREALPKIRDELTKHPPTVGLVGVSGTGKSSTINAMFGTHLLTSDTVACTKNFEQSDIELDFKKGVAEGISIQLRVIDAPGLGEDVTRDPEYIDMYHKNLPECDVILWVLAARNRAMALDQMYLREFKQFYSKIVFGLNQVDLVEPMNWNERINLPSVEQEKNVEVIVQDRQDKLKAITESEVKVVAYSAKTGYNLQDLFTTLVTSCPPERAWIFEGLQGFHYTDFVPKEVLEALGEEKKKERKSWWSSFRKTSN